MPILNTVYTKKDFLKYYLNITDVLIMVKLKGKQF